MKLCRGTCAFNTAAECLQSLNSKAFNMLEDTMLCANRTFAVWLV